MSHVRHHVLDVSTDIDVLFFPRVQETPAAIAVKAELDEEAPPKAARSLKEGSSPKSEADAAGEMTSTSWVVDSSGFLSPTGPVLKEVLELVDGVSTSNRHIA